MCSSSTSLSSSTTLASSTASILSLAEGEAATSLVLQDDVISVLGAKGDELLADQDADNECVLHATNESGICADDDAVPDNCEPSTSKWALQCGLELDDNDYCWSASVDTWVVTKPAVAVAAAARAYRKPSDDVKYDSDAKCGQHACQFDTSAVATAEKKSHDVPAAKRALLCESKSRAARVHAVYGDVPAVDVTDPVPAADCVLPGASKLRAARGQAVYAHATPTVDCAMPGASKSRAARGHEDRLKVNAVAAAIASVPAANCALPGV